MNTTTNSSSASTVSDEFPRPRWAPFVTECPLDCVPPKGARKTKTTNMLFVSDASCNILSSLNSFLGHLFRDDLINLVKMSVRLSVRMYMRPSICTSVRTYVCMSTIKLNAATNHIQGAAIKDTPLQKSHYFENKLIFFGEIFRGYS